MAAAALLDSHADPSDAQIDAALAPALCRCGSYQRVRQAVHRAAHKDWGDAPFPAEPLPPAPLPVGHAFRFNPWVSISSDGTVLVTIERSEMGQGIITTLAMLVAEELDYPLERIRTEFAPVDHAYDNPVIGMQITVGSMSVHNAWMHVRRAGADARERLIATAAKKWAVDASQCNAREGEVVCGARRLDYGQLAEGACALAPVVDPRLHTFEEFRVLGKPTARLEIPGHVAGRSRFGMDVELPNMLVATVLLPARIGATLAAFDALVAKSVPGVRDVFAITDGIAIVAADMWSAIRGREAVIAKWTAGSESLSTSSIRGRLRASLARCGDVLRDDGSCDQAFDTTDNLFEAQYETPYLAHAPIEPMNCTVRISDGRCDVWAPTQGQTLAQATAARVAGLPLDAVRVHTTFLGGGFGRRSAPDVIAQAVEIAKRVQAPVQLVWSRADDFQHDRYRPASAILLRAALDDARLPTAIFMRVAGPKLASEGIDIPYDISDVRIEAVEDDPGVPTHFWRSVGASQNAFAIESFIDELAALAGIDPVRFRLDRLARSPRHRTVLELAAEKADWDSSLPSGRARGVALYSAHGGWSAQVAEISIQSGVIRVHRVVCAVDCGFAVNPDIVAAQMEGAIAFGLTAALKSSISIEGGRIEQKSFRDYPILTIGEMPKVDVHIVRSREDPSGAGECGVPPIAPAVANALFAATARRVRSLPLTL